MEFLSHRESVLHGYGFSGREVVDFRLLVELCRAYVLKMLKEEGAIDDAFITMVMKWRHISRFNTPGELRFTPDDAKMEEGRWEKRALSPETVE